MLTDKTLICGCPADIENRLAADITALKSDDPLAPITVVVRSNLQGIHLRRRVAVKSGGVCNLDFSPLTDLAKSLIPGGGANAASPEALALLARAALHAQSGNGYFGRFRDFEGAESAFASTFKELSLTGFTGFSGKMGSGKIADLHSLYNDYRKLLERNGLCEEGGLFAEAGSAASRDKQPLFIYGIYEFFGAHKLFIEALAETRPIRVYLPYNEHLKLPTETRDWLLDAGFTPEAISGSSKNGAGISRFADNLFVPGIGKPADDATINIIAGRDEYEEVKRVAAEIIRLIAEEGAEPSDIAVIVDGLGEYLPIIDVLFGGENGGARIPYYLSPGFPAELTREGRALLLLLGLIAAPRQQRSRFDIVELLSFVRAGDNIGKSPLYNRITLNAGIITGEDFPDKLETYIERLNRKKERARRNDDECETEESETEIEAAKELRELSRKLFKYLGDFDAPKINSWEYFCSLLRAIVDGIFTAPAGYNELLEHIEQLAELDQLEIGGTDAGKSLFISNAVALIEGKTEPKGSFGKSGVSVLDIRLARGLRFDTVFVLGLVEGSLPRKYRQDPILLDDERKELNKQTDKYAKIPLHCDDTDIDEALFWSVLHTAEERLYLCCPCAEENALHPKVPSYYLLTALGKLRGKRYSLQDFYRDYGGPTPGYDEALSPEGFFLSAAGEAPDVSASILTASNPYFQRGQGLARARYSTALTEYDGCLSNAEAVAALQESLRWGEPLSPTVLESYLDCPFKFFLSSVLKLRQPAEADKVFELTAMDKGNLVHSILFDFYSSLRDSDGLPLSRELLDEYENILSEICAKRFAEAERGGIVGLPLSWETAKRDIERAITAYVAAEAASDADMIPAHFELRFGYRGRGDEEDPKSTTDPYRLDLGDRELLFSGKIDRVDLGENEVRAIDYKSGKSSPVSNPTISAYNTLQLPIYLLAAANLTGTEIPSVDALYSYIYQNTTRELSGEALYADLVMFKRKLAELLRLIETGYLANLGKKCGDEYNKCDWVAVCRPVSDHLVSRKQETPPAVSYGRMLENDFDE